MFCHIRIEHAKIVLQDFQFIGLGGPIMYTILDRTLAFQKIRDTLNLPSMKASPFKQGKQTLSFKRRSWSSKSLPAQQKREQFHNQEGWSTPIFRSLSVPEHANVKTRMLGTDYVRTLVHSRYSLYYQRLIAIVVKRRVIIIGNQVIMVIRSIVPPVI